MKIFLFVASILFFIITYPALKIGGSEMFAVIWWYIVVAGGLIGYYTRDSIVAIFIGWTRHLSPILRTVYMQLLTIVGYKKPGIYMSLTIIVIAIIWIQTSGTKYNGIMYILLTISITELFLRHILHDIYAGIIHKRYRAILIWLLVLFMVIALTILQLLR